MKLSHLIFFIAAGLSFLSTAVFAATKETPKTAPEKKADSRIEVIFKDPDNFIDVKDGMMGTDKGRDGILDLIKEFIETRGAECLPEYRKLTITFTDIDLAGEYEPWRGSSAQDIRIVKDIYPPRFDFTYKITDAKTGALVSEGKETLRDMAFMMRVTINRSDSLHFEKEILSDWLLAKLPAKKK